jgi:hypothetical protein
VRIVDQANEWTVVGHVAQHAKGGQANQESVRRRSLLHAEGDSQCVALRSGKVLRTLLHRRAKQLLQAGKG